MNEFLSQKLTAALEVDAAMFAPELVLCGAVVFLLLVRLIPRYDRVHMGWLALPLAILACYLSCHQWYSSVYPAPGNAVSTPAVHSEVMFGGMLVYDNFSIFIKVFLSGFLSLLIVLTMLTGIPDKEDSADFYVLLFGSTIGMSIISRNCFFPSGVSGGSPGICSSPSTRMSAFGNK